MKLAAVFIPMLALVAACGGDADTPAPMAGNDAGSAEVSVCGCVSEPINSGARAAACAALMDSMSPNEAVEATMACRAEPPPGGPDLCFCVQTSSTDPEVMQACEALLPENPSRAEMTKLIVDCSRTGS